MTFRPRERWLWIVAVVYIAVIYASAYFVQFALDFLRESNLLRAAVAAVFLVVVGVVTTLLARSRPSRPEVLLAIAVGSLYLLLFSRLEIVQERVHLVQYGILAAVVYEALRERRRRVGSPRPFEATAVAALLTALAGWGDEGVQYLLPNRYYDLRDVSINGLAGLIAAVGLGLRDRIRLLKSESGAGDVEWEK